MTQVEAFLVSNRFRSFADRNDPERKIEYHELTFLIEDEDGGTKIMILRTQNPDIKGLKPTFKEAIKGKFPYGKLNFEYSEVQVKDASGRSKAMYKPRYHSFKI